MAQNNLLNRFRNCIWRFESSRPSQPVWPRLSVSGLLKISRQNPRLGRAPSVSMANSAGILRCSTANSSRSLRPRIWISGILRPRLVSFALRQVRMSRKAWIKDQDWESQPGQPTDLSRPGTDLAAHRPPASSGDGWLASVISMSGYSKADEISARGRLVTKLARDPADAAQVAWGMPQQSGMVSCTRSYRSGTHC